jgi:hypothetical protein
MKMVTSDERMKILDMIRDGKLSVDDGAKLLSALEDRPNRRKAPEPRWGSGQMFRVRVSDPDTGRVKVTANLPMSLVDAGLNMASNFSADLEGVAMDEVREAFRSGMTGKIIDVMDEEDNEHVEIFIE